MLFLRKSFFFLVIQFPDNERFTELNTGHPCRRKCDKNDIRICYYNFKVESYTTMSRACYNCPENKTDCSRQDCVPADGISRPIITVNRQMPGPSIEVMNKTIIVDLHQIYTKFANLPTYVCTYT